MKQFSGFTSTRSPTSWSFLRLARLDLRRSSNVSPIAVRMTFLSALRAFLAAPEPRPPQPIKPTFIVSPGEAAEDLLPRINGPDKAPPMAATVELLRKVRREVERVFVGAIRGCGLLNSDINGSRLRQASMP